MSGEPDPNKDVEELLSVPANPLKVPNMGYPQATHSAEDYVSAVRMKYIDSLKKTAEQKKQQLTILSEKHDAIADRMRRYHCEIDIATLSCRFRLCGRTFSSVEVLAYHVSYAHQDFTSTSWGETVCLVCGRVWKNVKCKVVHLSAKHRNLGREHNRQCSVQVEPVIAPDAPMAIRLEEAAYVDSLSWTRVSQVRLFEIGAYSARLLGGDTLVEQAMVYNNPPNFNKDNFDEKL